MEGGHVGALGRVLCVSCVCVKSSWAAVVLELKSPWVAVVLEVKSPWVDLGRVGWQVA